MRTKLVFWGKQDSLDEKVLITLALNEIDNSVDIHILPAGSATEELVNQLRTEWKDGKEVEFPENTTKHNVPLTLTERMLPDGYTVDREDILKRAQTEWNFVVLSAKMYTAYADEVEDFKEKIRNLQRFDKDIWNDLKGFWSKVQEQVREKNLFREHANSLKDTTNELFAELKRLRKELDKEFKTQSDEVRNTFLAQLQAIDKKVEEGLSLQPLFNELKNIQRSFKKHKLTKDHRAQVWNELDGLFKKVKEKKFGTSDGPSTSGNSPLERTTRRYNGLIRAIEKMEQSIVRDEKEFEFQKRRVERAEGSLEAQIRAAKITMIEERIHSKKVKLQDMVETKLQLEKKIEKLKEKEERKKEQQEIEAAKQEIKRKIAEEIKQRDAELKSDEKIQKAAEQMKEGLQEKVDEISVSFQHAFENAVDTVKAIAHVFDKKIDEALEEE